MNLIMEWTSLVSTSPREMRLHFLHLQARLAMCSSACSLLPARASHSLSSRALMLLQPLCTSCSCGSSCLLRQGGRQGKVEVKERQPASCRPFCREQGRQRSGQAGVTEGEGGEGGRAGGGVDAPCRQAVLVLKQGLTLGDLAARQGEDLSPLLSAGSLDWPSITALTVTARSRGTADLESQENVIIFRSLISSDLISSDGRAAYCSKNIIFNLNV